MTEMRLLVILFGIIGCQAVVYKPADNTALKAAVRACVGGTSYYSGTCNLCTKSTPHDTYGTIGDWDVSDITSFEDLFGYLRNCRFEDDEWDISNWDVSSVTNMKNTFQAAEYFNTNLSLWDVSSVTTMYGIFKGGAGHSIGQTDDSIMFDPVISDWDVSSVTTMEYFASASAADPSRFVSDLSKWDVSSVTNMRGAFNGCFRFNSDLSNWDVGEATWIYEMFSYTSPDRITGFVGFDLSRWNINKVIHSQHFMRQVTEPWNPSGMGESFVYDDITLCTMTDSQVSKYKNCQYCPSLSGGCTGNSMKCKRGFDNVYPDDNPHANVQSFTCGCGAGSYKNVDWATAPDVAFDPDVSPCIICPVGTYQDQADQLSCNDCPFGKYQNAEGQISCEICPVGTYQDATSSESCKICPLATYQDKEGHTSCNDCPSGQSTLSSRSTTNDCFTATQIRDKFLETQEPDLVPAYNIAMRGSECGYKMVEYEEIGGDCKELEARPSGVQPDTYDTPYQFTIVGDDTCGNMCAKLEVCQAYHYANDVCTGVTLSTSKFSSVFNTTELTIGNMHLTSLSTHTILVPDYTFPRSSLLSDPLVTKNFTTSSIHVLGLRRYCSHPLIYLALPSSKSPGTTIYYNELGVPISPPPFTAENIFDECAAVCRSLARPSPYGELRTSTTYTWSEIVCKGFEISFTGTTPTCYMATSSSGNGVTPSTSNPHPDCFAVGDPELYKWKDDSESSETCYVKKHLDLL